MSLLRRTIMCAPKSIQILGSTIPSFYDLNKNSIYFGDSKNRRVGFHKYYLRNTGTTYTLYPFYNLNQNGTWTTSITTPIYLEKNDWGQSYKVEIGSNKVNLFKRGCIIKADLTAYYTNDSGNTSAILAKETVISSSLINDWELTLKLPHKYHTIHSSTMNDPFKIKVSLCDANNIYVGVYSTYSSCDCATAAKIENICIYTIEDINNINENLDSIMGLNGIEMTKNSYIEFTPYINKDTKSVYLTQRTNTSTYFGRALIYKSEVPFSGTDTPHYSASFNKILKVGDYTCAFLYSGMSYRDGAYIRFKSDLSQKPTQYQNTVLYRGTGNKYLASNGSRIVALLSDGHFASSNAIECYTTDDGITWTKRNNYAGAYQTIDSFVYFNGYFYTFTHYTNYQSGNYIYGYKLKRSSDGISWSNVSLPTLNIEAKPQGGYSALKVFNNKLYIYVSGYSGYSTKWYSSTNGTTWIEGNSFMPLYGYIVIKHPDKNQWWAFKGPNSSSSKTYEYYYSTNGDSWTSYTATNSIEYTASPTMFFKKHNNNYYIILKARDKSGSGSQLYIKKYDSTNPTTLLDFSNSLSTTVYYPTGNSYTLTYSSGNWSIYKIPEDLLDCLGVYIKIPTPEYYEKCQTIMGEQEVT